MHLHSLAVPADEGRGVAQETGEIPAPQFCQQVGIELTDGNVGSVTSSVFTYDGFVVAVGKWFVRPRAVALDPEVDAVHTGVEALLHETEPVLAHLRIRLTQGAGTVFVAAATKGDKPTVAGGTVDIEEGVLGAKSAGVEFETVVAEVPVRLPDTVFRGH